MLAGCDSGDETALEEAEEEGQAEALVGENITISGQIGEVLNENAVVLNAEYVNFGLERGTLVYSLDEGTFSELNEGDYIQASGTVDEFLVQDYSDEAWFDNDLFADFEEEFALQADAYELVPEIAGEGDDTALSEAEEEGEAEMLVGETVTVAGEAEEIIGANAFRIFGAETGEGTLVFSADNLPTEGALVEVTGTVIEFIIVDIEEDLGIDLDDDLFVDFEDQFAIVADEVEDVPEQ